MDGRGGSKTRVILSEKLTAPLGLFALADSKALRFKSALNTSWVSSSLVPDLAVKAAFGSEKMTYENTDNRTRDFSGDSMPGVESNDRGWRWSKTDTYSDGKVLKLFPSYEDKNGISLKPNFGWVDDDFRQQSFQELLESIKRKPQIKLTKYDVNPKTDEVIQESAVEIDPLSIPSGVSREQKESMRRWGGQEQKLLPGRPLRSRIPGGTLIARAAAAIGVLVDENNKFRCPPGTPAANQFTDRFGSTCFGFSPSRFARYAARMAREFEVGEQQSGFRLGVRSILNFFHTGNAEWFGSPPTWGRTPYYDPDTGEETEWPDWRNVDVPGERRWQKNAFIRAQDETKRQQAAVKQKLQSLGVDTSDRAVETNEDLVEAINKMRENGEWDIRLVSGILGPDGMDRMSPEQVREMATTRLSRTQGWRDLPLREREIMIKADVARYYASERAFLEGILYEYIQRPQSMRSLGMIQYNPNSNDEAGTSFYRDPSTGEMRSLIHVNLDLIMENQESMLPDLSPRQRLAIAASGTGSDAEAQKRISDFLINANYAARHMSGLVSGVYGFASHIGHHETAHVYQGQAFLQTAERMIDEKGFIDVPVYDNKGQLRGFRKVTSISQLTGSDLMGLMTQMSQDVNREVMKEVMQNTRVVSFLAGSYPKDYKDGSPVWMLEVSAELYALREQGLFTGEDLQLVNRALDWMDRSIESTSANAARAAESVEEARRAAEMSEPVDDGPDFDSLDPDQIGDLREKAKRHLVAGKRQELKDLDEMLEEGTEEEALMQAAFAGMKIDDLKIRIDALKEERDTVSSRPDITEEDKAKRIDEANFRIDFFETELSFENLKFEKIRKHWSKTYTANTSQDKKRFDDIVTGLREREGLIVVDPRIEMRARAEEQSIRDSLSGKTPKQMTEMVADARLLMHGMDKSSNEYMALQRKIDIISDEYVKKAQSSGDTRVVSEIKNDLAEKVDVAVSPDKQKPRKKRTFKSRADAKDYAKRERARTRRKISKDQAEAVKEMGNFSTREISQILDPSKQVSAGREMNRKNARLKRLGLEVDPKSADEGSLEDQFENLLIPSLEAMDASSSSENFDIETTIDFEPEQIRGRSVGREIERTSFTNGRVFSRGSKKNLPSKKDQRGTEDGKRRRRVIVSVREGDRGLFAQSKGESDQEFIMPPGRMRITGRDEDGTIRAEFIHQSDTREVIDSVVSTLPQGTDDVLWREGMSRRLGRIRDEYVTRSLSSGRRGPGPNSRDSAEIKETGRNLVYGLERSGGYFGRSATDSSGLVSTLSSGKKKPSYPREPTMGAFIGETEDIFSGARNWSEFWEIYKDRDIVFLDYETTGLVFDEYRKPSSNGNPTQLGLVKMRNGEVVDRLNMFMNPEEPLSEWSRENTKDMDGNPLTDEWLSGQQSMADAHRRLAEFAGEGAILGVQNATFDKRVLDDALSRAGIDWRPAGYLDTKEIAEMTLPRWTPETDDGPFTVDADGNKRPSNGLAAITKYLGVDLGDKHHTADADAEATGEVMTKIIQLAIERGWSSDVLDRGKREAKKKELRDKFEKDIAQFESDVAEYRQSLSSGRTSESRSRSSFQKIYGSEMTRQEKANQRNEAVLEFISDAKRTLSGGLAQNIDGIDSSKIDPRVARAILSESDEVISARIESAALRFHSGLDRMVRVRMTESEMEDFARDQQVRALSSGAAPSTRRQKRAGGPSVSSLRQYEERRRREQDVSEKAVSEFDRIIGLGTNVNDMSDDELAEAFGGRLKRSRRQAVSVANKQVYETTDVPTALALLALGHHVSVPSDDIHLTESAQNELKSLVEGAARRHIERNDSRWSDFVERYTDAATAADPTVDVNSSAFKSAAEKAYIESYVADLCGLYEPGSNLLCSGNLGIDREKMPQLGGRSISEKSTAARMGKSGLAEVEWVPVDGMSAEDSQRYAELAARHESPSRKTPAQIAERISALEDDLRFAESTLSGLGDDDSELKSAYSSRIKDLKKSISKLKSQEKGPLSQDEKRWFYSQTNWQNTEIKLEPLFEQFLDGVIKPTDGGPAVRLRTVKPEEMAASQQQLAADKSAKMADGITREILLVADELERRGYKRGTPEFRREFVARMKNTWFGKPLLASMDGRIIDGHHRWAGIIIANRSLDEDLRVDMQISEIQTDAIEALTLGKIFQDTYGIKEAALGKEASWVGDSSGSGIDEIDEDELREISQEFASEAGVLADQLYANGHFIRMGSEGLRGDPNYSGVIDQRTLRSRSNLELRNAQADTGARAEIPPSSLSSGRNNASRQKLVLAASRKANSALRRANASRAESEKIMTVLMESDRVDSSTAYGSIASSAAKIARLTSLDHAELFIENLLEQGKINEETSEKIKSQISRMDAIRLDSRDRSRLTNQMSDASRVFGSELYRDSENIGSGRTAGSARRSLQDLELDNSDRADSISAMARLYRERNGIPQDIDEEMLPVGGYVVHRSQIEKKKNKVKSSMNGNISDSAVYEIGDKDEVGDGLTALGEIELVLKPEVSQRTAYSAGESFSSGSRPVLLNSANRDEILDAYINAQGRNSKRSNAEAMLNLLSANLYNDYSDINKRSFDDQDNPRRFPIDAQILGGFDKDEVQQVNYPYTKLAEAAKDEDISDFVNKKTIADRLRAMGFSQEDIEYFYSAGFGGEINTQSMKELREYRAAKKMSEKMAKMGFNNFRIAHPEGKNIYDPRSYSKGAKVSNDVEALIKRNIINEISKMVADAIKNSNNNPRPMLITNSGARV